MREQTSFRLAETMNLLGDEAFVEELSRALDLPLARAAGGLLDDPPVGRRQAWIPELRSELGYRQVEAGRRRPTRNQLAWRSIAMRMPSTTGKP